MSACIALAEVGKISKRFHRALDILWISDAKFVAELQFQNTMPPVYAAMQKLAVSPLAETFPYETAVILLSVASVNILSVEKRAVLWSYYFCPSHMGRPLEGYSRSCFSRIKSLAAEEFLEHYRGVRDSLLLSEKFKELFFKRASSKKQK